MIWLKVRSIASCVLLGIFANLSQAYAQSAIRELSSAEVAEVVSRHESAVGLIHTADVTVCMEMIEDTGKQLNPPKPLWELRWSKEQSKQRFRCECFQKSRSIEQGSVLADLHRFYDAFENGEVIYLLKGWNPKKPPTIKPDDQRSVRGYIFPPSPLLPDVNMNLLLVHALFDIAAHMYDARRTLRQFLSESPTATKGTVVEFEGQELIRIVAMHPDTKHGKRYKDCQLEMYLDTSVNCLIKRLVVKTPPQKGLEDGLVEDRVVRSFKDLGGGVFFPATTEYSVRFGNQPKPHAKVLSKVTEISVNKKLARDAMDFRFPEHCVVTHSPPVNGKNKVTLYGKNNQPLKEIHSIEDIIPASSPDESGFFSRHAYVIGWIALALLVVVAIGLRQRNS